MQVASAQTSAKTPTLSEKEARFEEGVGTLAQEKGRHLARIEMLKDQAAASKSHFTRTGALNRASKTQGTVNELSQDIAAQKAAFSQARSEIPFLKKIFTPRFTSHVKSEVRKSQKAAYS